jgi:P-aminobenzoate N-oxygenase AurF
MSTFDLYTVDPEVAAWQVPAAGSARFSWEYQDGRDRLLALYQKGKDKQWDGVKRIDWSLNLEPDNPIGTPDEFHPLRNTVMWDELSEELQTLSGVHLGVWQFSQFLHGEQGAMLCAARIVEGVPDMDSKFYAATQVMDEARHVEVFSRLLQEKVGQVYPINRYLKSLLDDTLTDARWDMPYLGMQVLIEGLALAAFGMIRDTTRDPLIKQVLAYIMSDEARHVAFGRLALRDYYAELTSQELAEREEFVIEGCHLMRNRFRGEEVFDHLELDSKLAMQAVEQSPYMQLFRSMLFSRIVPCVKDIGLWSDKVQRAYADMGVLDLAGLNLDDLMADDAALADELDRRREEARYNAELAERRAEIDAAIADGGSDGRELGEEEHLSQDRAL